MAQSGSKPELPNGWSCLHHISWTKRFWWSSTIRKTNVPSGGRSLAALRLHHSFLAWPLKHRSEMTEPLAPGYCVSISRSGRKKAIWKYNPPTPANHFLFPGWVNSDACRVDFSLWLLLCLPASLCSSFCSMSTFHRRLSQPLSCYRSQTRCRVFDRYQPNQDAKKRKWTDSLPPLS